MLASNLIRIGVVIALVGLAVGIGMGIADDFRLAPAHAHLNLVGFVTLFLAGLYYAVVPEAAETTLAKIQGVAAVAGAVLFPTGISLVVMIGPQFVPVAIAGALIVFLGMALLAWIVFRFGVPLLKRPV